jgi:hypothetical protein
MEGSCEHGNEPSRSIKCLEIIDNIIDSRTAGGVSSRAQLFGANYVISFIVLSCTNFVSVSENPGTSSLRYYYLPGKRRPR